MTMIVPISTGLPFLQFGYSIKPNKELYAMGVINTVFFEFHLV